MMLNILFLYQFSVLHVTFLKHEDHFAFLNAWNFSEAFTEMCSHTYICWEKNQELKYLKEQKHIKKRRHAPYKSLWRYGTFKRHIFQVNSFINSHFKNVYYLKSCSTLAIKLKRGDEKWKRENKLALNACLNATSVLVLAGMELILFTVACIALCFGFMMKIGLVTFKCSGYWWAVLTESHSFLILTLPH